MAEPALFISTGGRDQESVRILNTLFAEAAECGVSDVHFEDFEEGCRVRFRTHGQLTERAVLDRGTANGVASKIRMRAKMSLSDRDIPLDGRMHLFIDERIVDVRVSLVPTNHGESIVCRLLDQRNAGLPFDKIEMEEGIRDAVRRAITMKDGMLLATGPTGSGKTTTLYSILSELNTMCRKIITIEDPVEYRLPLACQIPITTGMSFPKAVRAVLRQDPDVILVGEIRDRETAQVAVQAAMTGHLVLSTLHANDAITTVGRMLDLLTDDERPDPFLLEITMRGVIAQRLVRRLCTCAEPYSAQDTDIAFIQGIVKKPVREKVTLYRAKGCEHCNQSGFRGRLPVVEYLEINPAVRQTIQTGDRNAMVQTAQRQAHYKPLSHAGIGMALEGKTTLGEIREMIGDVEESH